MTKNTISRRNILAGAAVAGASVGVAHAGKQTSAGTITPEQTEGPFYPVVDQPDKDADLTKVEGRDGVALGEPVIIEGTVFGEDGKPIANAVVDVWQANAAGRYAHEKDPNPAPLDPNFQSWAIMTADENGRFRFKTVKPGAYPVAGDWSRPPHIHFKVSRRGFKEITTQMYFPGEPLNDIDRLFLSIDEDIRPSVVAKANGDSPDDALVFDIVLAKA